jgi:benzoyl-CoA reductase/2-hydroxyglutaryl-CoA dehydratase subunit BcrC/BadD/HgdB
MSSSAVAELTAGFDVPFGALGHDAEQDRSTVVISWPSVPVEIVRATGFRPVVARGIATPTPEADAVLEADLFPSRIRQLVEAALTGRLAHVAAIVLPRTSEADYKCFLYLRELVRRGVVAILPPVWLFDLLQSTGPEVPQYDSARARDFLDKLAALSGVHPEPDELRAQIALTNRARAAARRLDALRRYAPRVAGAEAVPLLGAFWQLDPERYAALVEAAVTGFAERSPLGGPRVLLAGAPVDSTTLHAAIETEGAVVVAELSPFGSAVAAPDVDASGEPVPALAEHYRNQSIDARLPVATLMRRIEESLDGVDAVVISLPPDDSSFGWDYPRLRELLERRSIPHAMLQGDPVATATAAVREDVRRLLGAVAHERDTRRG